MLRQMFECIFFCEKKRHFKEYFFVHAMKVSEVQNIAFIYLFNTMAEKWQQNVFIRWQIITCKHNLYVIHCCYSRPMEIIYSIHKK